MKFTAEKPVVIVGAGLGGLTLAIALKQLGIPAVVLERSRGLSEVGAGIVLWENALKVLEHIGALNAVLRVAEPSSSGTIGTRDGRILVHATSETAPDVLGRFVAAHRAELQAALYGLLPEGTVRFATTVENLAVQGDSATLALTNGQRIETPLLVGADGLRSKIREWAFGPEELRYSGHVAYRGICEKPVGRGETYGEFWGSGDRFGVIAIPHNRLYWFAVLPRPLGTPRSTDAQAMLLHEFRQYALEIPRILAATPENAILYHELFDRKPRPELYKGPLVLLGDAAHPTTPNMGQGAAMAMESALLLARALEAQPTIPQALALYQALRAPRTRRVTETSFRIGKVASLKNPLLRSLRNFAFRVMPESARLAQLKWVAQYDASRAQLS